MDHDFEDASKATIVNLNAALQSTVAQNVTPLTLPEIQDAVARVGKAVPAGNIPAMILSGLARLPGRQSTSQTAKRDVNLLFKGVEQTLDRAIFTAFFAGPAAVIWGYQTMLRLVGKDPDDAFPEGTWQFYVDYALREDTARHTHETHGFDSLLNQHGITLNLVDRMTAWTMAAIHCQHQYDDFLANEWRERVMLYLLRELVPEKAGLYHEWQRRRPYGRGGDAGPRESYPEYRRRVFDRFIENVTHDLTDATRQQWLDTFAAAEAEELPDYQRQMSILRYLEPGPYDESRTPVDLVASHVALIHNGHYYLIPTCKLDTDRPTNVLHVRAQIAHLVNNPVPTPSASLTPLATIQRGAFATLRKKLTRTLVEEIDSLRSASIMLNFDQRPTRLPLSDLRQAERGVGDHALTIFDTGKTFVFDQSHIFFDGAWGAALAEIVTNEALAWGAYLSSLPSVPVSKHRPLSPVFQFRDEDHALIAQAPRVTPHVSAESSRVDLPAMLAVRRLFRGRHDLLRLTINDLLVLYRAIHAVTYHPKPALVAELRKRAQTSSPTGPYEAALAAIDPQQQTNTIILIPVDASLRSPRDRLFPMTLEIPIDDLDLIGLGRRTMSALDAYKSGREGRQELYTEFDELQRKYLAVLAGFGIVLSRAKESAVTGETPSVRTIKLLAHMPTAMQRLLDQIPNRIDMLNDMIKGREVFSNVGAVVKSSTLTRFSTAKDDNTKKTLVWGVLTDALGLMRISLRDFRPHVGALTTIGERELADRITQDYLEAYVNGLNDFIYDLHRITLASRETRQRVGESE